jgi:phosphatidylserine/phosphatidylglycerophosphate/cardiolipin synthase-like enzyme
VDLAGTVLEWDGVPLRFPAGAPLAPGGSAYVAWQAAAFTRLTTRAPEYALDASGAGTSSLSPTAGAPHALQPSGGSVRLLAPDGEILDAFLWGDGTVVRGWQGPAVAPASAGAVYQRAVVEASLGTDSPGSFVTDVGTAAAWRQGTDWLPRRSARAGQSEWRYPTFAADGARLFACPDCSHASISQFIDQAAHSLIVNLYLFTQTGLVDRVSAAIQRGVAVRLLLEGEPFEGMPPSASAAIAELRQAGAQVRLLHAAADGFKRYRWDHAKYAVADDRLCLVMSDNWTNASAPATPGAGQRGWGAVLDSAPLAAYLTQVFEGDWNPQMADSMASAPNGVHALDVGQPPDEGAHKPLPDPASPVEVSGPVGVTAFLAPEHALLETRAICGLIGSSARTLDVIQSGLQLYWGLGDVGSVDTMPNLFLAAVVAAARRGVTVRVLMDGAHLDPQDPRDHTHTKEWLQALAQQEHLALEARILDAKATGLGIHDKGLIVDGQQVLISSINWSENSPAQNRELALILEHPDVAGYFGALFAKDWARGA